MEREISGNRPGGELAETAPHLPLFAPPMKFNPQNIAPPNALQPTPNIPPLGYGIDAMPSRSGNGGGAHSLRDWYTNQPARRQLDAAGAAHSPGASASPQRRD